MRNTKTTTPEEWKALEPKEYDTVLREVNLLSEAADKYEMSFGEIGEHLSNIRKILEPKKLFNKWLTQWRKGRKRPMSRSWAYQLMKEYEVFKSKMPKPVLEMALQRGAKLNPQLLLTNPPPKTDDRTEVTR